MSRYLFLRFSFFFFCTGHDPRSNHRKRINIRLEMARTTVVKDKLLSCANISTYRYTIYHLSLQYEFRFGLVSVSLASCAYYGNKAVPSTKALDHDFYIDVNRTIFVSYFIYIYFNSKLIKLISWRSSNKLDYIGKRNFYFEKRYSITFAR